MEIVVDADAELLREVEERTDSLDERDEWVHQAVRDALDDGLAEQVDGGRREFIEAAIRRRLD